MEKHVRTETNITVNLGDINAVAIQDRNEDQVVLKFWTQGGPSEYILPRHIANILACHILGVGVGSLSCI